MNSIRDELDREYDRSVREMETTYLQLNRIRQDLADGERLKKYLEAKLDDLRRKLGGLFRNEMPEDPRLETPMEDEVYDPEFETPPEWRS